MKHCKWTWFWSLLVLAILAAQPASAVTDYVFFSVYGDTTLNVAAQGDSIGFGANCTIGATIFWQIWVDADSNQIAGDPGDKVVLAFTVTDGGVAVDGPSDVNPVPDGWFIIQPMMLGFAPAHYIMVATDMTDATSAEEAFSITPMLTPPNMFTGTVTLEGVTAPDPQLANVWMWAEPDGGGMQFWTALTDDNGYYELSMPAEATDIYFRIRPENLPGFVTPAEQFRTVSGEIANVDFDYTLPADSVYGYVMDEYDNLIPIAYVYCSPQGGGPEKRYDVTDGSYVIYFGPSELGFWWFGVSAEMLAPNYMAPQNVAVDNSITHSINLDLVCYTTDTVVYAKITEMGGAPAHEYMVTASSQTLQATTEGVSGTGADNILPLHVTSLDTIYQVGISQWDDRYPIPAGYVVEGGQSQPAGLGDTVTINLVLGNMVQDTIKLLPPDNVIDWSQISVNLSGPGSNISVHPDNGGVYTAYVSPGMYNINIWNDRFLALPNFRTVMVTGDTVGGMGFTLNYANCHVTGHITGLTLPLDSSLFIGATTGPSPDGYNTGGKVDAATGAFDFYVCDGSWQFNPPMIFGANSPSSINHVVLGTDTDYSFDFAYQPMMLVSGTVTVDPDDPPVNWNNVQVRLNGTGFYQVAPDNNGNFAIYADTGTYMLDVYYINYLTTPGGYFNLHLLADTTAGLNFLLNVRDIRVHGYILGVSLPIQGGPYNVGGGTDTYPLGFHVASSQVDNATGYYEASVCDGNWTFTPPDIPGYVTPLASYIELIETDTVAIVDLSYSPSSVDDPLTPSIPKEFNLSQNSPNPFNMATRIDFALPKSSDIELAVYNILGQKVITLAEGTFAAGTHSVGWDGLDENGTTVSTGIYFYRLDAGDRVMVRKMVVLK